MEPSKLDDLTHDEIRAWLQRALSGTEAIPRFTRDESPSVAILRLERSLKPPARDSVREGCRVLVSEFCNSRSGDPNYLQELVHLASGFRDPETVENLARLAADFGGAPDVPPRVQLAVLATLVDTPPMRDAEFWESILEQDPQRFGAPALSGLLATDLQRAVNILPRLPEGEDMAEAAALKLDLAWDTIPIGERLIFLDHVRGLLKKCGKDLAFTVGQWIASKQLSEEDSTFADLRHVLNECLGVDASPRFTSPKIWAVREDLPIAA